MVSPNKQAPQREGNMERREGARAHSWLRPLCTRSAGPGGTGLSPGRSGVWGAVTQNELTEVPEAWGKARGSRCGPA